MSKHAHTNNAITPRDQEYSQWYLDIISAADLAEHGDVKGTMIIKPYGYAIWERIQRILDDKIKETGHHNAYFPLFIPKSFLSREADHVEGFAKECAVVTHHRLMQNPNGEGVVVDPDAKLQEELIVRPTSETVIHSAFARWIKSWRDLPVLINQWANVVRWELRPRLFLRTTEFLWQEGHTAHSTEKEAEDETLKMLTVYKELAQAYLAMPVVDGQKSESEKFAGALRTYTIEAMMQDGKALQAGTSHNLGQNFAKAFEVQYLDKNNQQQYVWMTSWGVSTRLMGGLIMTHSDDKGLVLPPVVAPWQVVIVPIWKTPEEQESVQAAASQIAESLRQADVRVHMDTRDFLSMGQRLFEWEKKGVPLRIEIGPRDVAQQHVVMSRRDQDEKQVVKLDELTEHVSAQLKEMQKALFDVAQKRLVDRTMNMDDYGEFKSKIEDGGFFAIHWCGKTECEEKLKQETKATVRCIPFAHHEENGACLVCGLPSKKRVIAAKAY